MSNDSQVLKEQGSDISRTAAVPEKGPVLGLRGRIKNLVNRILGIDQGAKSVAPTSTIPSSVTLITPPSVELLHGESPKRVPDPGPATLITPPSVELLHGESPKRVPDPGPATLITPPSVKFVDQQPL